MTRRVLEKLCTKKVCVDLLVPTKIVQTICGLGSYSLTIFREIRASRSPYGALRFPLQGHLLFSPDDGASVPFRASFNCLIVD